MNVVDRWTNRPNQDALGYSLKIFNLNTTNLHSVWPSSSPTEPIEVSQLSFPSLWGYLNHWITTQGEIRALNMSAHSIPQSKPCAKLSSRERAKNSLHDPLQIPILSPQVLRPPPTAHFILWPQVSGSSSYPIPIPTPAPTYT